MTKEQLKNKVRKLMLGSVLDGYSALLDAHYCYVMPSKERYQFQWFWDTCFHVFILCAIGEVELAQRSMLSLFRMQEDNGFVGHMVFWNQVLPHRLSDVIQARPRLQTLRPHMSALTQPPLVAQAVKRIYDVSRDRLFLYELMPKLVRFHDWLAENRDFEDDGLISIISPFESGIDWKPSFDEVVGLKQRTTPKNLFTSELYWRVVLKVDASNFLRQYDLKKIYTTNAFIVKEVCFNTLYACDLRVLSELCATVDLPEKASHYAERARKVGESILRLMYDEETAAFFDLRGKTKNQLKVLTPMCFLPMLLPEVPEAVGREMVVRHFDNADEFRSTYPMPSVAINDPSYDPNETLALWRGPTWPVLNWLLYKCLREKGFVREADALYRSVQELIEKSGFREYYHPFTGEGYGAKDFTWSALVVDMD
jgi:glycogen debranching enzyme